MFKTQRKKTAAEGKDMSKIPRWKSLFKTGGSGKGSKGAKESLVDSNKVQQQQKQQEESLTESSVKEVKNLQNLETKSRVEVLSQDNKATESVVVMRNDKNNSGFKVHHQQQQKCDVVMRTTTTTATELSRLKKTDFRRSEPCPKSVKCVVLNPPPLTVPCCDKISRAEISRGMVAERAKRFEEKIVTNIRIKEDMSFRKKNPATTTTTTNSVSNPSNSLETSTISNRSSCPSSSTSFQDYMPTKSLTCTVYNTDHDKRKVKTAASDEHHNKDDFLIDDEYSDQPQLLTLMDEESSSSSTTMADVFMGRPDSGVSWNSDSLFNNNNNYQSRSRFFGCLLSDAEKDIERSNRLPKSCSSSGSRQWSTAAYANSSASNKSFSSRKQKSTSLSSSDNSIQDICSTQLCQDVRTIKTGLLRLRRFLQEEDELNHNLSETTELESFDTYETEFQMQNEINDLKQRLLQLQQQGEEKDRKISLLQRQLKCHTWSQARTSAATQTETANLVQPMTC